MLKDKIKNKEKLIGMYVCTGETSSARIAGLAGYDCVWLDTEHSSISNETVLKQMLIIKGAGTPVIVRVPQFDLTATKHILEMGPDGIIFPMIKTAEDANKVIASTLYPPYGDRGFGPQCAIDYGFRDISEYEEKSRNEICRFIQIEQKECVENIDEIMKNEYIDGYIFGPNDLAHSYGFMSDVFCDEITKIIKETIEKLHSAGKYVAIASGGHAKEVIEHWHSLGADLLFSGADYDLLRDKTAENRENLKKIHKN